MEESLKVRDPWRYGWMPLEEEERGDSTYVEFAISDRDGKISFEEAGASRIAFCVVLPHLPVGKKIPAFLSCVTWLLLTKT